MNLSVFYDASFSYVGCLLRVSTDSVSPFCIDSHGSSIRDGGGPQEGAQGHQGSAETQTFKKKRGE